MTTEVVMPQMGESIAEGTITKWMVEVGAVVARDQPLFEITTDKVDAEIPSPAAGTLVEIRHQEGETVAVDTVVALIGEAGEETVPMVAQAAQGRGEAMPLPPTPVPQVPSGTSRHAADEGGGKTLEAEGRVLSLQGRLRRFSSPLVRNIAAKEQVDLSKLEGTGIQGRVTKRDILQFLEQRATREEAGATAPSREAMDESTLVLVPAASPIPAYSVAAYTESENVTLEPMSRIRQITAGHMLYSQATSAHVTTVFHVDMSRVVHARTRAKDAFAREHGTKLTYMPFIFQAVLSALRTYPKFNAALDGTQIVYKRDMNLGMAVALDHGLIVPVIRDADKLSLVGLARSANELAERARDKRLKPEEVRGGTFTITNPGVFGSLFGTPIINQPQVAILCVGTIEKRPVVMTDADGNDSLAIRSMSYFALTYDHRLIDGADAERFLADIKASLAKGEWSELTPYL